MCNGRRINMELTLVLVSLATLYFFIKLWLAHRTGYHQPRGSPSAFRPVEIAQKRMDRICPQLPIPQTSGDICSFYKKVHEENTAKCRELSVLVDQIYDITERSSSLTVPEALYPKMTRWLDNDPNLVEAAENQNMTFIFNRLTREHTIINSLRSKRPQKKPAIPDDIYVEKITDESQKSCDFCQYRRNTAKDPFGRIETAHVYTATNVFKYDRWHSMVVLRDHHPLIWDWPQFLDLFQVALQWFDKVYNIECEYKYPIIVWDLLPHAGASQVHPHIHVSVTPDRYYGHQEVWHQAALEYGAKYPGRNYFNDLIKIHAELDLVLYYKSAVTLVYLTAVRDYEIVIISHKADEVFFYHLYKVARAYIDKLGKLCFSMAVAFPPMGTESQGYPMPVIARMATRGSVSDVRQDVTSLELFGASNINSDHYKMMQVLRESWKDEISE